MLRQLDERTLIAGQIAPEQVAELKSQGIAMIVNNRPDGEDAGQPTAAQIEAAADGAGLAYRWVPIRRGPGPADVEAMQEAMRDCGDGKLLAFCRSGARSTFAWALARHEEGVGRDELERAAAVAGVSLAPIAHLL
ncbi:MAG: Protein tyrosine phosphatase [uncultured Sphingomonas sp.]|uniref:Protein tyrosine phosphatase n=1 Tax=uncultured Sphingomonas sp. TaxID=158754 RepID=A0A6J4SV54_9SPHN|nr:MAG: Protein tyrosine phosphatase [uncultured Sphingomonas sp.]